MTPHTLFAGLAALAFVVSVVAAGGYAPIPYDPQEHQTAAQATAIAGALVGFRGSYSAPVQFMPVTNRANAVYHNEYFTDAELGPISNRCGS